MHKRFSRPSLPPDDARQRPVANRMVAAVRAWWSAAATRITLGFAARGALAVVVPFAIMLALGQAYGAVFAALGGLFTVLADTGGSYRRRFAAMLVVLLVGGSSLYLGTLLAALTWLLPLLLAAIAFASGMARVFGGSSIAIGLFANILFLVGAYAPGDTGSAAAFVGFYAIGNLWVVCVHLALWRLRPYRILLQEIAASYDAAARLVTALELASAGVETALARRYVRVLHRTARERIRKAEATLESLRVGYGHSSAVFDHALLLLSAVSREVIAATSLRAMSQPEPGTEAARAWRQFFRAWRRTLKNVSRFLLTGRGSPATAAMHAAFDALDQQGEITRAKAAPLRLALLHMDAVAETGVLQPHFRLHWRATLPRPSTTWLGRVCKTLATNLTFASFIFRHALRVAVAAGFGLWFAGAIGVPRLLWLPMTTIVVLQPEFGATWRRLWARVAGTLGGVLIAGGAHFLVHDSLLEIAIIALFAFAAFYFIRSAYSIGIVMLTPMILLLLGVLMPDASAMLILARGLDTILGGMVALAAAFVLWPLWQRDPFLDRCAQAVLAQREYLARACDQPGDGKPSRPELMQARHAAERATDNADATLQRMLSEPRAVRGNRRAALGFVTYLRRLADNAAHFSVALRGARLMPGERAHADELLQRLDMIAAVLSGEAQPTSLAMLKPQLEGLAAPPPRLALWFERFAADTAMLAIISRRLVQR